MINVHVPPKKWCSNVKSANTCTNITFKCKTLQSSAKRLNKCTITQQHWHCRHLPMYRISLYLIPYCSWLLNLGYVYKIISASLTRSLFIRKWLRKIILLLALINPNPSNSFLFLHIYHVNFHYSNRLQGICLLWWWRNPEGRSNCCVGFNVSYTDKGQWVVLWTTMWIRWASWSVLRQVDGCGACFSNR